MLEYNEQTENLMEIAMMLEQLKGESEYLFEVLTDIDSITWKQKFASVSLEGKTLWILRSMPVTTQQILRAKLAMQLLLSGISVLFAAICTCIAFAVPL